MRLNNRQVRKLAKQMIGDSMAEVRVNWTQMQARIGKEFSEVDVIRIDEQLKLTADTAARSLGFVSSWYV